jgi:hypothetical protein
MDGGEAALHRVFGRGWADCDLPTAIFAVSDEVAMGVLYAAREHGLKVPRDLSVVGVDGHDFAYLFDLTTISQPVRDQGRIAARLLLEQVNSSPPRPASVVSVGSGLIRRGTTGPARTLPRSSSTRKQATVPASDRKRLRIKRSERNQGPAGGARALPEAFAATPMEDGADQPVGHPE